MDKRSRRARLEDETHDITADNDSPDTPGAADASGKRRFDLRDWMKKNPQAARTAGGVAVLVVLLVVLVWYWFFTGSDKKKVRRPPPVASPATQPAAADPAADTEPAGDGETADSGQDPDESEPGVAVPEEPAEEPEPEVPPLPEDVSQWEQDDFERARREGDPKLLEAIGHLGTQSTDKEAAVKTLSDMLLPPKPDEVPEGEQDTPPGGTRGPVRHGAGQTSDSGRMAEAALGALANLDTDSARKTLERVISGELVPEGDESKAVEAALKALAEHPSPGNEGLLFRVLTEAERFRDSLGTGAGPAPSRTGGGVSGQPLSAEGLRSRVLALVEKTASATFRAKLATFLIQPTTPLAWRAEMGEFLLESNANNLGAQFVMYRSERLEDEVRLKIEEHFAGRSAHAAQAVLGIPPEAVGAGGGIGIGRGRRSPAPRTGTPVVEDDPELAFRLARQLWGERSTEVFTQRLNDIDRRDEPGHLLALCATMPVESVRGALLNALKAGHARGPDPLEKAGIPQELVHDPGFLLVVKSLDRREPQAAGAGRPAGRGQPPAASGRAADDAGQKWMQFSEELVCSWCERLDAAARAQAEKARMAGKNPEELRRLGELPIALHENAVVRSAYHHVLPGAMAEKLAGAMVGPMRVQYVRLEERTSMKRMLGYYRRIVRVGVRDGRPIDGGVWLDTYRSTDAPGVRCSLDVLIRIPDVKNAREIDMEAEENMVIEVLSVEAREP